jgi:hypothetical protein
MASRNKSSRSQEAQKQILAELLKDPSNKTCADCRAKGKYFVTAQARTEVTPLILVSSLPRTSLGVMESGRLSMYTLCWDPSKPRRPHK